MTAIQLLNKELNPASQWNISAAMKHDIFVKKPLVTCHIELFKLDDLFS